MMLYLLRDCDMYYSAFLCYLVFYIGKRGLRVFCLSFFSSFSEVRMLLCCVTDKTLMTVSALLLKLFFKINFCLFSSAAIETSTETGSDS